MVEHSDNGMPAHATQQADLDTGAFSDAHFVIRHRNTPLER